MISVLVKYSTGGYCEEQIGVLLNKIGGYSSSEKPTGDAIRKKRLFLRKYYPMHYADALRTAIHAGDFFRSLSSQ
jgi:hypothetical protein